jgi:hypothetical protein
LHDGAPFRFGEEQIANIPSGTEAGNSVTLAGKEVLDQGAELAVRHGIDGGHTRAPECLTLFDAASPTPRHQRDEERENAQQECASAEVARTEGGANGQEAGAGDRNDAGRILLQKWSDRILLPLVPPEHVMRMPT